MKTLKLVTSLMVISFLASCVQLDKIKNSLNKLGSDRRLAAYKAVSDKDLVNQFYSLSKDGVKESTTPELKKKGFEVSDLTDSRLVIKTKMFNSMNMSEAYNKMARYQFNLESDPLSIKYSSFVKSRGNILKLYQPKMGTKISSLFTPPFQAGKKTAQWNSLDNALIEYTKDGRAVSMMIKSHQAKTTFGVDSYQYTSIIFGQSSIRHFENSISNAFKTDTFIREFSI